jgi:hypothetical protein
MFYAHPNEDRCERKCREEMSEPDIQWAPDAHEPIEGDEPEEEQYSSSFFPTLFVPVEREESSDANAHREHEEYEEGDRFFREIDDREI